jgi:hypothetical protein
VSKMTTHVISGFHPAGYLQYGRKFLETFDRYWPRDIRLTVVGEEPVEMPRGRFVPLFACDGVEDFINRHKASPERCGRINGAYNFKFDAVKFCRQGFIPHHVGKDLRDNDIMAWLDADVHTFQKIPEGFVEQMLGDADVCHLGRLNFHSELGFWACRINDRTRLFLDHFAAAYRHDVLFDFAEWHSAFVFDEVRKLHEQRGLVVKNITPNGGGHVWFQCDLGRYTDHLKGEKRKAAGASAERLRGFQLKR